MAAKLNLLFVLVVVLAATLHCSVAQRTHVVGDSLGWTIPPGGAVAYTTWASAQTFAVGDILVFNFTTGSHTVAEVSRNSFDSCDTTSPISVNSTGPVSITLAAGQHFYICTVSGHCTAGQKLAINVSGAPPTSRPPAPAPQPTTPSPVPAPQASSPSPAPTTSPAPATSPAPSPSRTPQTYVVGDALGWTVPPRGAIAYQTWARNKTFNTGDILVFNFATNAHDVVILPSKAAYDSCNASSGSSPLLTGPARITLTTPGEHFYICGVPGHCSGGQKLAINVTGTASLAPSSAPSSPGSTPSPSPSGSTSPTTPSTPSPAGESAPPPPNSAPAFAGAALPITFLAVALALFY